MSKTLLIYERAVPVNYARHGDWGVKIENDFSFAKNVNSMPLLAQEFRDTVREHPIVFAGSEEQIMPAVLLGIRDGENLYVDEAGKWDSKYIPAFARRYPYVFSSNDQGKTLTLCIDEEFKGLNQDGEGERLFTTEGEQTPYLISVLKFQTEFQKHFQHTQMFCNQLRDLNLLEPMQAQFKFGSGEKMAVAGFMVVNRDRLKGLSGDVLTRLSRVDALELIYLHLQSMNNVSELAERISPTLKSDLDKEDELFAVEKKVISKSKKTAAKKKRSVKKASTTTKTNATKKASATKKVSKNEKT